MGFRKKIFMGLQKKLPKLMCVVLASNLILQFPLFSEIIGIISSSEETFFLFSSVFLFIPLVFLFITFENHMRQSIQEWTK